MERRRVVITGLGIVSPLGCDLVKFWDRLVNGQSGVRRITRFDASRFTSQIAGEVVEFDVDAFIPKKEQRRMDPFSHYGMGAAKMAVADSGLDFSKEDPRRVGVVIGTGIGGLQVLEEQHTILMTKGPSRFSPFMIPQMITNIIAGLVAIEYGLKGPNFCVTSACATATHSMGESLRMIQCGDADMILAGGTEAPICALGVGGFCAMRALSTRNDEPTRASRPFDADRDGFVCAEGAGVLVLEELEHARKRGAQVYCELAGYGRTCDAYHITAPDEKGAGATESMKLATQDAGLNADQIDYINAHGTSTKLNDKGETLAIKQALGEERARKVMVSSTKSMTGHLLGAAGAIEAAACALALRHGVVPPTINYETPDPDCDLDYVPNTARQAAIKTCLSNSLGFGGHNATLCFKAV
ncbi:MAG: beta-ketoacyl-ACP synthase II [Kiritimatiellae bacterium]|nr:beta-ketoacyl-ACP synthase II [Kiritimatiellia bacterium]